MARDTVANTVDLFAHYLAIIDGTRDYLSDKDLAKLYGNGIGREGVSILLRNRFSGADRKKKMRRRTPEPEPKKPHIAPVSEKSVLILQVVRQLLEASIYPSPVKIAAEIPGTNPHMIAEVCCRYLNPQEKAKRERLQTVGRRWRGHRKKKKKK